MLKPLTKEQADYAAEHHNLVYAFLKHRHDPQDELYDIAIFGYLSAVQRYHESEALRQYAFSAIAFRAMEREIARHHRAARRSEDAMRTVPLPLKAADTVVCAVISELNFAA